MKLLLQCQGFLLSKSTVGPGQKLSTSFHLFCGLYILLVSPCSLRSSCHLVCFPNWLNCIPHKYIFNLCIELAPVFSFRWDLSCCSCSSCVDIGCTWISWAWGLQGGMPVLTLMAGETGPHSSVIQPTTCFQTQHVFHICSEDNSGILNSNKLYSGTDCSDFPDFLVNGCSAAHKMVAKGSQAAFCVKPLWSIPYINTPWCKPHNCFTFRCVLNILIISFYSFLPGGLLSSFFLSVFWLVWANLTTSLKLILGEKKV